MLNKKIYIVFLINILTSVSDGIHVSEFNDTKMIHSMNSQISELRAEQKHHDKLIEGIFKALDLQILKAEQERQKVELEQLKKDGVNKDSAIELLKAELKLQKKDEGNTESKCQSLKVEMEHLKKDGDDKESRINFLTAELERQGKIIGELNMQLNNQTFRAEQERQGKLIKELVQESKKHNSLLNPHNCSEAKLSGIYETFNSNISVQPFKVACDANTRGGGWTIILKRIDGSEDFYRNWAAYKEGFGDLNGEFFLGLDKIHALTTNRNHELLVVLEDNEGNEAFELYESFAIGDENQQYVLHTLGKASGTAGDSLDNHRGKKFTTFDRDNDDWKGVNCAVDRTGAWWYHKCHNSHLTGKYNDNTSGKGVNWFHFKGFKYSLKKAVMMIRPKK